MPVPQSRSGGCMTEDRKENALAECLEEFHTRRARGEVPDMAAFEGRLGEWYDEFKELILAETFIDEAMTPPTNEPLPLAFGAYTLLHEIGRGAAGVVYEAVHRKLGRKVALKVLRTGIDTDDTARKRFEREAQALAQVRHDHIVEIYEFGDVAGSPYYAMELVEGPTLIDLVKRGDLPEPKVLCESLAGVTDALHTLHENGIVHRDVKPSNIMVRPDGRYVLADFGLARTALAQTMTKTGDALGTPLYMSPEQMLGNRDAVDRRTDVYGVGATLYQLLTGRPPFKTDNLHALMRMILTQRPDAPRAVQPELPGGCSSIAAKCLEKEPGDRYVTAEELGQDLRAFAAGERVSGKPLTRVQRGARWVKRHRALSAAALVLVAVGAWFVTRPPEPGRLSLEAWPGIPAEVQVNDGPFRDMPLVNHALIPDEDHLVVVRPKSSTAFTAFRKIYRLDPDEKVRQHAPLPPADESDPAVMDAYLKEIKVASLGRYEPPPTTRSGGSGTSLDLSLPRGTVRPSDLTEWLVVIDEEFDFPDGGWIEFRLDGKVLDSQRFPEPNTFVNRGTISAKVRDALKPGDRVTWGFRAKDGRKLIKSTTFLVNDVDLDQKFAEIDERLLIENKQTRDVIRAQLRATMLLSYDLATAAYRETEAALAAGSDSLYLLSLQQQALEKIFPKRERDDATLWNRFMDRWTDQPLDAREAFVKRRRQR